MANNGAISKTLNAGQSYTVPAGYHNGSGKVTANSLASQTQATAVAGDILTGKTAWVNGKQIAGTMSKNREGKDISQYFNMTRQSKSGQGTVQINTASSQSIDLSEYDYLEFSYYVQQHNRPVCRVTVGSDSFELGPYSGSWRLAVPVSKYKGNETITFTYGDSNATTNYTIIFQLLSVELK